MVVRTNVIGKVYYSKLSYILVMFGNDLFKRAIANNNNLFTQEEHGKDTKSSLTYFYPTPYTYTNFG